MAIVAGSSEDRCLVHPKLGARAVVKKMDFWHKVMCYPFGDMHEGKKGLVVSVSKSVKTNLYTIMFNGDKGPGLSSFMVYHEADLDFVTPGIFEKEFKDLEVK